MGKSRVFYRWGIVVIIVIVIFLGVQTAKAEPPEDFDFTVIQSDARYVPGELLVRSGPKENDIQLSKAEKTQILYLQLKGMLDIMR